MLRGALDEDIHGDIVREVRRRDPSLDIISIRETSLLSEPDHIILAWVAAE